MNNRITDDLIILSRKFEGEIFIDDLMKTLYATDASAYKELPFAVALPKNTNDIKLLISFASFHKLSLIPRAAGTSLAGQVVGSGIIVDTSKYFTKILEINEKEKWVIVEPGVVPDELNKVLAPLNLFWGPETSTSNRCKLGGMLGNNSCGSHSLIYGSTRDHTISVNTILSDGSEVEFKPLSEEEYLQKLESENLEGEIYKFINNTLSDKELQDEIAKQYPDKSIKRRNTGYALDILSEMKPFDKNGKVFNMAKLLAGSEGTLAFTTKIKLNLVDLPPKNKVLVCVHLNTIQEALKANLIALEHKPFSVELMDKAVIDLTKGNKEQNENRFFVEGDPGAILIVEFAEENIKDIETKTSKMKEEMLSQGFGYHFPIISGKDMSKVWSLRKAGLGVLSNMPGDLKPVPVIEDTAVRPIDLPEYINDFDKILKKHKLECVYYAHVSTGELHLRPVMNLKDSEHIKLFRILALETAQLVKKYNGSLSGEHGDGRLRGEFIPLMLGEKIYSVFKDLKKVWDPNNILNPEKIISTPPMNSFLRYDNSRPDLIEKPVFDYSKTGGLLQAAEKCNGSGDCLKSSIIGGTMCPSYMATRDEKNSTRARANILREYLTNSIALNPIEKEDVFEVFKLCLSCKACKSECPSSVDISKLKAEFLQHYYDKNGTPLKVKLIAYLPRLNKLLTILPKLSNYIFSNRFLSAPIKKVLNFHPEREIPLLGKITVAKWMKNHKLNQELVGTVYLFNDEFTNYQDSDIGVKSILLLNKLGYKVIITKNLESGRTLISKGLIRKAKKIAIKNVKSLKPLVNSTTPLIGIEPSAILTFRDEYPELVGKALANDSKELASNCLTFDEFISKEFSAKRISSDSFTKSKQDILLHGHCQQKAIASSKSIIDSLSIPLNYSVDEIPSGCCGMAGSFGYEKENFDLSMKIGNMVLFPSVEKADTETIICAAGTSCRCQIADGTDKTAFHPVEILFNALIK